MEKRHYEILLILRPTEDEKITGLVDEYVRILKEDGEIERMEQWGLRRLAYAIKDHRRGFYVLINTCCRSSAIEKLEERFRFEDNILRFMIMRQRKAQTGESPVVLSAKNSKDRDRNRDTRGADYQRTGTSAPKELPKPAERTEDWSGENVDPDATGITQPKPVDTTQDNPKKESEPNPGRQSSEPESPTPEITGEASDASAKSVKDAEETRDSKKPGNPDKDNQDNTEEEKEKKKEE